MTEQQPLLKVLNYNFNLFPRGSVQAAYQEERIASLVSRIKAENSQSQPFDVLVFQEVFASAFLPAVAQRVLCHRRSLLDQLADIDYVHVSATRQPSYWTMARYGVTTDTGLCICSRYPIARQGSMTFRSSARGEQRSLKGCLYVKLDLRRSDDQSRQYLIVFNVHVKEQPSAVPFDSNNIRSSATNAETQLLQVGEFISAVLKDPYNQNCPFVICGDFNVNALAKQMENGSPFGASRTYDSLVTSLQSACGPLDDAIESRFGKHFSTRPPVAYFKREPLFPLSSKDTTFPPCCDYVFVASTPALRSPDARIERFVADSRKPYQYLSDHFAIVVELSIERQSNVSPLLCGVDQTIPILSHTPTEQGRHPAYVLWTTEVVVLCSIVLLFAVFVPFGMYLLPIFAFPFLLRFMLGNMKIGSDDRQSDSSNNAEESRTNSVRNQNVLLGTGVQSIWALWHQASLRYNWRACIAQQSWEIESQNEALWLSFKQLDDQSSLFGSGLSQLGVLKDSLVGVAGGASRRMVIAELGCCFLGAPTIALTGSLSVIRQVIDSQSVKVVICSKQHVLPLLECRSTVLSAIIALNRPSYDEEMTARDLNIQLISFDSLIERGRKNQLAAPTVVKPDDTFTIVLSCDTVASSPPQAPSFKLERVTHRTALSSVATLCQTKVMASEGRGDRLVWYAPFHSLFHRIVLFSSLASGVEVACADTGRLHDALKCYKPTMLVVNPSFLHSTEQSWRQRNSAWSRFYRFLFDWAHVFRVQLLRQSRDSSTVKAVFFRWLRIQLGGKVRLLIINSGDCSVPYPIFEFAQLNITANVREVFFSPVYGVYCVDGLPSPSIQLQLVPFFDQADAVLGIGRVRVKGKEALMDVCGRWSSDKKLVLLGTVDDLLWPVSYDVVNAAELERVYSQSRFVQDIFITCQPGHRLVAIVHPSRDFVEELWRTKFPSVHRSLSWSDVTNFALPLILADFRKIAESLHLADHEIVTLTFLHPHAFADHGDFFTPLLRARRGRMASYFSLQVERLYGAEVERVDALNPSPRQEPVAPAAPRTLTLQVPVAVDIGGTFAKVVYLRPPGVRVLPPFVEREYSMLEKIAVVDQRFFALDEAPSDDYGGELCFVKLESGKVPEFVQYLGEVQATQFLRQEVFELGVRATGGGAFKYAPLVQSQLGVKFQLVREMDSVVAGVNLMLKAAPESIFTVSPDTGEKVPMNLNVDAFPFLLVNIGSGVSIVRVTSEGGKVFHERVGGSAIGGATFWGLVRTMTNIRTWEEVSDITRVDGPGDNTNVDLLVGDIYGFNARELPAMLSVDTVASTFGKLGTERFFRSQSNGISNSTHGRRASSLTDDDIEMLDLSDKDLRTDRDANELAESVNKAMRSSELSTPSPLPAASSAHSTLGASSLDIVRSLLIMMANNVTQLAYLHSRAEGIRNVFFTGGFVRDNPVVWKQISRSMNYWSRGAMHAHFLAHDGYVGALGAATMDI